MSARIEATGLAVGYGHRPIVEGLNFSLQPGELLVLIGTNGSGKSTLLKTLAGLVTTQSGEVKVLGGEPGTQHSLVGYLPQHPVSSHTLPLRVEDVAAMGRYAHLGLTRRARAEDHRIVQ
jgi:ABC-type Mn2+/Zn2+ transport system ATPase subunit